MVEVKYLATVRLVDKTMNCFQQRCLCSVKASVATEAFSGRMKLLHLVIVTVGTL